VDSTTRHLPNPDRISVLAGTILLAYLLTPYVNLPAITLNFTLPGVILPVQLNFRTLVSILVAALTATGADWLVRGHPAFNGRITVQHWLLPALTAWVLGSVLFTISFNPLWWLAMAVGGMVLILVLVAEYIVVDRLDARYPLASAGLSALAFGLFLALAITLDTAGLRLFIRIPFIAGAAGLVTLRVLHLRLSGKWAVWEAVTMILICAQLVAVFQYWPISAASYGLLLLAPLYCGVNFIALIVQDLGMRRSVLEPAIIGVVLLGAAIWLASP
jgi:hypothetical protein